LSGNNKRRRDAIALGASAAFHIIVLAFVINETVSPYSLPTPEQPPIEVQIFPQEEIPPPPVQKVVIPPKIKQELEKQAPPPPPPQTQPTPPKPQIQTPAPIAPPKIVPPKPSPPAPAQPSPPAPQAARPAPPRPNPIPAAPTPAKAPAPPAPSPSPSPAPSPAPAPSVAVTLPSTVTAKQPAPQVELRPSKLNLHKTNREVPQGVPTLPLSPPGGPSAAGGPTAGGGGGAPGGGAPGAGSRLNGLSPYPYGALPSGGPGLRGTLVGCANAEAVNLTSVERAHCNERFGEEAAKAPTLDGMDPAKRARFDKAADKQERDRAATMPVGTSKGLGGMGGLGRPNP
jgi:hypothetical protein